MSCNFGYDRISEQLQITTMISTAVLKRAIKNSRTLDEFRCKLTARNRDLISRCELVLTPSTLEIYPDSRIIEAHLCRRIRTLSDSAKKYLNVKLIIRSDGNGDMSID